MSLLLLLLLRRVPSPESLGVQIAIEVRSPIWSMIVASQIDCAVTSISENRSTRGPVLTDHCVRRRATVGTRLDISNPAFHRMMIWKTEHL